MPTTQQKANKLLKKGEANVIKRKPFTIKLTKQTGENKQSITLGIDIGFKNVGISAITDKKELYSSETTLRTDIVDLNIERRMYRRNRRNINTWYRPARFLNRKNKKEGWIAPSIQHKIDSHLRIVDNIAKIIPISKIIVEIDKFDIQKIMNPEISGIEYQNGVQKDFENIRSYVLYRDNHECQNKNCEHKKEKNIHLHVHHITQRKDGGSDRPENLITICNFCHDDFHQRRIKLDLKKSKSYKEMTCMNIIRYRIYDKLSKIYDNVEKTYGYITKVNRIELNIEKSHINDAFIIAGGDRQERCFEYKIIQRRRNNRCLQINRKKFGISIRKQRYLYQPMSLVRYKNKVYSVIGSHCKGSRVMIKDIKNKSVNVGDINLVLYSSGLNYV